jgi:hypothetical protein
MASRSLSLMVVVLFEGAVDRRLERWRRLYDPLGAERIPPHLMLVSAFPAQLPLLPLERRLWAVCRLWSPIWLELGDIVRDGGLFCIDVAAGGPELARLRDALYAGPLAGKAEVAGPFRPLVVVAEPPTDREVAQASQQLLGLPVRCSYEVKRLHLMATHGDGAWYVNEFFGLDGTYGAPRVTEPRRRAD